VGRAIEFSILGPFEVVEDGPMSLGGPKQRAVLLLLLLNRGQLITTERIIHELWGEHPPATASKTIQVYVSKLRKELGDGLVVTRGRGYLLAVEPDQVDVDRFEELTRKGRQALERGYPQVARERLAAALSLWRGRPMDDFSYEEFAQSEIARLEEAHVSVLEDRIEADLAVGEHAALIAELEAHVRAHPARERLWGQLMVALYRSGRQADALERYRRARRTLIDEFAIEPGAQLKSIERGILTQDPKLDPPVVRSSQRKRATEVRERASVDPAVGGAPTTSPEALPGPEPQGPAAASEPKVAPTANGHPPRERPNQLAKWWRRIAALAPPTALLARFRALRRTTDARWAERRLVIAGAAALLVVAVVAVAVFTGGGGSARRQALGGSCSSCVVSISSPAENSIDRLHESVATTFACSAKPGGPAIKSCRDSTGSVTTTGGRGRLDTSTLGRHIYTVIALTANDTVSTTGVAYSVVAAPPSRPLRFSIDTFAATVAGGKTSVTVTCSGGQPNATCRGGMTVSIVRPVHGRSALFVIADRVYSVPSGAQQKLVMRLNKFGLTALRRAPGHHRRALVYTAHAGGGSAVRGITLQLG
jgi:DNA-binding SARP family transcriptional activator